MCTSCIHRQAAPQISSMILRKKYKVAKNAKMIVDIMWKNAGLCGNFIIKLKWVGPSDMQDVP